MKRIFSLIFIILLAFCENMSAFAVSENYDTLNVITYDYDSKSESVSTLSSELELVSGPNALNDTIVPAYCPDTLERYDNSVGTRSIIGSEDRKPVNPNVFPYSAVTYLYLGQDTTGNGKANSWGAGTGFMVGEKVMLTAAHCYWSGDYGWVEECRTYVKQNSSTLGTTYYYPASWRCLSQYKDNLDYRYDWCVVTMQDSIGNQTGCFGYGTGGSMLNKTYTISGYPGDYNGFQYSASGSVSYEDTNICKYDIDTNPGQSGAPVYDSDGIVWAIATYEGGTFNQGNKLTATCCALINAAKK